MRRASASSAGPAAVVCPSRTALGTVRTPASTIGPSAKGSAAALHHDVSPAAAVAIWTPMETTVTSMASATSRFIGRASVVTRR